MCSPARSMTIPTTLSSRTTSSTRPQSTKEVEEETQDIQELDAEDSGGDSDEEQGAQNQDAAETGSQVGHGNDSQNQEAEDDLKEEGEKDGEDDDADADADAEDNEMKGPVRPIIAPSNNLSLGGFGWIHKLGKAQIFANQP
ncbi:hypothetical protein KI688_004018 [Linnemannia hyalina]|uniref:Uncharacterized protein n=1 Tax=Linnemannia hyalina TaxID=64524 RepID=A0A9P7XNA2_9FUNG|nr:hypothetical protein KI688_004018 [Linnemannia hyalina]